MDSNIKPKILVDAVITWVDGTDKDLSKKKAKYLNGEKESKIQNVKTRYNQVGEIEFVIKSIIKFAPFINNIFIVTDGQSPKIIDESNSWRKEYRDKLKVIDHKVIFREFIGFLPTFNSTTIETMLHYIPNLSEYFIYFNDDMFLIKPTKISDWFKDGRPIVSGKWKKLPQNYTPFNAMICGVFLHGLSADIAVKKSHVNSLIASDITENLSSAFKALEKVITSN